MALWPPSVFNWTQDDKSKNWHSEGRIFYRTQVIKVIRVAIEGTKIRNATVGNKAEARKTNILVKMK